MILNRIQKYAEATRLRCPSRLSNHIPIIMMFKSLRSVWYTLSFVLLAHAQICENYGVVNGTTCACPVGFGGSTCSQIGCGGTIFQGSQRKLTSNSGSFANLTASTCQCESGWTGTGCNVCQTANACQTGFAAVGQPSIDSSSINGSQGNQTLVCNTQARVYASGQMSCQVNVGSFFLSSFPCSPDLL